MFWPHTKCPKHLKNFSNKIFVKNAQNVEIYQWNFFGVTHVFSEIQAYSASKYKEVPIRRFRSSYLQSAEGQRSSFRSTYIA